MPPKSTHGENEERVPGRGNRLCEGVKWREGQSGYVSCKGDLGQVGKGDGDQMRQET